MDRKHYDKLKLGTKVKLKLDLLTNLFYGSNSFVYDMEQFKGKWVTISYLYHSDFSFEISEDPENYTYTIEMIDDFFYFKFGK